MGRKKGNLGHRVPVRIGNPPNKQVYPEWWEKEENLNRLHPEYRRKEDKKKKKVPVRDRRFVRHMDRNDVHCI